MNKPKFAKLKEKLSPSPTQGMGNIGKSHGTSPEKGKK